MLVSDSHRLAHPAPIEIPRQLRLEPLPQQLVDLLEKLGVKLDGVVGGTRVIVAKCAELSHRPLLRRAPTCDGAHAPLPHPVVNPHADVGQLGADRVGLVVLARRSVVVALGNQCLHVRFVHASLNLAHVLIRTLWTTAASIRIFAISPVGV
eukprot:6199362-Pleurochrysis_carterae.AAC.1